METQFVTDSNGQKIAVILPIKMYKKMLEELEELYDIQSYDKAKKEDDGKRVPLTDYVNKRKLKNG